MRKIDPKLKQILESLCAEYEKIRPMLLKIKEELEKDSVKESE